MADLSILEFIVYALLGYAPMIFLLGYILVDKPARRSDSIMRIVYVMIGMIGVSLLGSVGGFDVVIAEPQTVTEVVINGSTGTPITNSTVTHGQQSVKLLQPAWILFNGSIFVIYMLYVIINVLALIGETDQKIKSKPDNI